MRKNSKHIVSGLYAIASGGSDACSYTWELFLIFVAFELVDVVGTYKNDTFFYN